MMRANRVRPYTITGGRTRPTHHLTPETQVVAAGRPAPDLLPEQQAIYNQISGRLGTVADLTADLPDLPETTIQVLLSDLITGGLARTTDNDPTTDEETLGRILNGLRELSP